MAHESTRAFAVTEARIDETRRRFPAFPRDPAVLVRLIKHIQRHVHDAANAVLREHGLNHTDYNLLMMLYGSASGTITPSQLAEAAGEKSANITRICNTLCEKGWIDRIASADDRRKVQLSLTAEGRARIEAFLPPVIGLLEDYTRGVDAADLAQLEALLKRMLVNAERVAAEAGS